MGDGSLQTNTIKVDRSFRKGCERQSLSLAQGSIVFSNSSYPFTLSLLSHVLLGKTVTFSTSQSIPLYNEVASNWYVTMGRGLNKIICIKCCLHSNC